MSKRSTSTTTTTTTTVPTSVPELQNQLQGSFQTLLSNYSNIPSRLKLIDSFLLFFILSGVLQFAYRLLVTSYPYNAFIGGWVCLQTHLPSRLPPSTFRPKSHAWCSARTVDDYHFYSQLPYIIYADADDRFGSTVGQFCLLAGLRAQIAPGREGEFKEVSQER